MEKQRLDEYLPLKDDDTESVDGKFQERKYNTGFSFSILLNLVLSLLLLIFLIVWLNGQGNRGAICGLPSDILFGESKALLKYLLPEKPSFLANLCFLRY